MIYFVIPVKVWNYYWLCKLKNISIKLRISLNVPLRWRYISDCSYRISPAKFSVHRFIYLLAHVVQCDALQCHCSLILYISKHLKKYLLLTIEKKYIIYTFTFVECILIKTRMCDGSIEELINTILLKFWLN